MCIRDSVGIGWEYHTLFGRDAGVALLVFFMVLKPMEMRTRRDSMVVVMLGFFLLLTHYFYSQSIPTGLWLLASTTVPVSYTYLDVYKRQVLPSVACHRLRVVNSASHASQDDIVKLIHRTPVT